MPEISVIIPVYNVEQYLVRCIESILKQIYSDYELILINDGSKDNSGKICDQYAAKYAQIRVIHQKNQGVSAARNAGLKSATGKYIIFMDSDDFVENDYLSSMAEISEDVDLVICGVKQVLPDGSCCIRTRYERKQNVGVVQNLILEMFLNDAISSIYSKRFTKRIIEEKNIHLDEELDLGEDGCFVMKYVCNCECIQYIDVSSYWYYIYEHGTLSKLDEQCLKRVAKSNKKMETILKEYFPDIIKHQIWKKKKYQLYPHCIFEILRNKEKGNVEKYKLLKSIYEIEEFQDFIKNIDICMPEDSEIVRRILSLKSPSLLVVLGILLEYKKMKR